MDRRGLIGATVCLPVVALLSAFVVAQTQIARLVGTTSSTMAIWPALEWTIAAALVAAWYSPDWPRWSWRSIGQAAVEVILVAVCVKLLVWGFMPEIVLPTISPSALVPTLTAIVPLALWCAAEETVLRGVLGRLTAAAHLLVRTAALSGIALVVAVLLGQVWTWHSLVGCAAIECVSVVGLLAGQPLSLLAQRRFWLRFTVLLVGFGTTGFHTGIPALVPVQLADPALHVLLIVSACVLWGCLILVQRVRVDLRDATNVPAERPTGNEKGE